MAHPDCVNSGQDSPRAAGFVRSGMPLLLLLACLVRADLGEAADIPPFSNSKYWVGEGPTDVAVADLNADGHLDIVTANDPEDTVAVLLGDGAGGFGIVVRWYAGDAPRAVVAADFTGDGRIASPRQITATTRSQFCRVPAPVASPPPSRRPSARAP